MGLYRRNRRWSSADYLASHEPAGGPTRYHLRARVDTGLSGHSVGEQWSRRLQQRARGEHRNAWRLMSAWPRPALTRRRKLWWVRCCYEITYENTGKPLTGITVTDSLPDSTTLRQPTRVTSVLTATRHFLAAPRPIRANQRLPAVTPPVCRWVTR